MKKVILLLVLCLCLPVWGLTEVPKVVDPDNGGGTDYTSLNAYEDALGGTTGGGVPGHLVDGDEIAVAQCRSSSGADDTTSVEFSGWTTDSTRYIRITGEEGVGDFPVDGIYDNTKYVLHNNDSVTTFVNIAEDYVRFHKIQFLVTETAANPRRGINFAGQTNGANLLIVDSCIFKGACSGTGAAFGIRLADANININIYNSIFTDFFITSDTGFRAIEINNCSTANIYNNTLYHNSRGISRTAGTVTSINNALFNNEDDHFGTITIEYCGTEEGAAEGANGFTITQVAGGYAALVTNAAGADFSVKDASSELYQTGNGATPKSVFTDDIIDTARPQAPGSVDLDWDVGAYELIAAAPPAGGAQLIIINMAMIPLLFIFTLVCSIRGKEIGK